MYLVDCIEFCQLESVDRCVIINQLIKNLSEILPRYVM